MASAITRVMMLLPFSRNGLIYKYIMPQVILLITFNRCPSASQNPLCQSYIVQKRPNLLHVTGCDVIYYY